MIKTTKPSQMELSVEVLSELDGVEMGVMQDGTAFLTGRGLASICGVAPGQLNEWAHAYDPNSKKRRDRVITRLIQQQMYTGPLFIPIKQGRAVNAFPEQVCMAVLEYYAFERSNVSPDAQRNYRVLARAGLRAFVYTALGYEAPNAFASYNSRLMLNPAPTGYFSVLLETSQMTLQAIRSGLKVDSSTVPDGSVGQHWARHWKDNGLAVQFGERRSHEHVFPDDYKQSTSAKPIECKIYPIEALPTFRLWLDNIYLPDKFPQYIKNKKLPASTAELILEKMVPKQLS